MLSSNGLELARHCPSITELTLGPLIESIGVFCTGSEYQNGHVSEFGTIVSVHLAGFRIQSLINRSRSIVNLFLFSFFFYSLSTSLDSSNDPSMHNFGWNGSWVEVTRYPKSSSCPSFFFNFSHPLFSTPGPISSASILSAGFCTFQQVLVFESVESLSWLAHEHLSYNSVRFSVWLIFLLVLLSLDFYST